MKFLPDDINTLTRKDLVEIYHIHVKEYKNLQQENKRLREILRKNGICEDCGAHWSHHITEPLASCECKTGEDVSFSSPYMRLQKRLYELKEMKNEPRT